MDLTGEVRIVAARDAVWAALNDPAVLARCIPGCDAVERQDDNVFTAKVSAKVGPVSAKFTGKVTLSDINPPIGYTLTGDGSGGAAGFGKGQAQVSLSEVDGETILAYTAKAQVGGKLAQIGSRIVDAFARKMADDFFGRFAKEFSPAVVDADITGETAAVDGNAAIDAATPDKPGLWHKLTGRG